MRSFVFFLFLLTVAGVLAVPSRGVALTPPHPGTTQKTVTVPLYRGVSDLQVFSLQACLKKLPGIYPEGLTTGYFGALTEKAVQRFQKNHLIVSSGSPQTTGYGLVGPKTRSKLNIVCGQPQTPVPVSTDTPATSGGTTSIVPTSDGALSVEDQKKIAEALKTLDVNAPLYPKGPGGCATIAQCEAFCAEAKNLSACAGFTQ